MTRCSDKDIALRRYSKGRGTSSNPSSRYLSVQRTTCVPGERDTLLVRDVYSEKAKSLLSKNNSPDLSFKFSINPYRGCEHGCIYCYARPSHAYYGLSSGLDFERKLFVKENALSLIESELSTGRTKDSVIMLGSNTDCYQPIEEQYQLTRNILRVLIKQKQPFAIVTKNKLVERDIDLLVQAGERARVFISMTSLDNNIGKILEPRATAPKRRLEIIKNLHQAGVPVGVLIAPVIPVLTDGEMENILEQINIRGADFVDYTLLRLPKEVAPLFQDWLTLHFPDHAQHILSLLRAMRGGKDNDSRFGYRFRGQGVFADLLEQRFKVAIKKLGLSRRIIAQANVCPAVSSVQKQLSLF